MKRDDASQSAGGLTAGQLEELIRREMANGAPQPVPSHRPERPLKPDVQRDLDALLGAIMADLGGSKPK